VVRSRGVALEFRILGPLEVLEDDRPARLGGPRQRAVLVTLLIHAGETVPTSRVIDNVWDEAPPAAAANVLQGYVSSLRKALGRDRIATRGTGYALVLGARDKSDVRRFEELVAQAEVAAPVQAAALLREALSLWRGPALAEFIDEPFARPAAARLEELRLHALEQRIAADLAAARHGQLVGELQGLAREHPLRERLRCQLMLALYRSGRQADALDAYRDARAVLVDELGIEPGPALQELERAILRQDPALELEPVREPQRAILVAPSKKKDLSALLKIAEPLARRPVREVIIAQIVSRPDLETTRDALSQRRDDLRARGVAARIAVFTSDAPGRDLARLATEQDVDLVLTGGGADLAAELLHGAPCDVGVLEGGRAHAASLDSVVLVPFGGADHDWAAVELGAWIAQAQQGHLRLVGVADGGDGRDASRLLASAALIVERMVGVPTSTALVAAGEDALVNAAACASLIVFGLPARWREKGPGDVRRAVARRAAAPTLLVRKGLRPGALAPQESRTRFTWSLAR
jgi:DNA-binding SARP family transcriptional activator